MFLRLPLDRLCLQVTRGNQGAANVDEDGGHLQGLAPMPWTLWALAWASAVALTTRWRPRSVFAH